MPQYLFRWLSVPGTANLTTLVKYFLQLSVHYRYRIGTGISYSTGTVKYLQLLGFNLGFASEPVWYSVHRHCGAGAARSRIILVEPE
jgi:hypothetical protein